MVFLPVEKLNRLQCEGIFEQNYSGRGPDDPGLARHALQWQRDWPCRARIATLYSADFRRKTRRHGRGCFRAQAVCRSQAGRAENCRLQIEDKEIFYIPSLSSRTIIYKGLLLAPQIASFYGELSDPEVDSALCLVHQRFSTNTFPSWRLAHPFRYVAHNGEINTLRGNVNWMHARQSILESPLFGDDIEKLFPIVEAGSSDSSAFDNAVELLFQSGRSMPHVMAMLIPEAWAGNPHMKPEKRAFYEYHASLMEPWDGPAAIAFTDGRVIGATLDRNGLRPGRYVVTKDDIVVLASEAGVLDIPAANVKKKGRLQPGKMFLVDTVQQRIISDKEIKQQLVSRQPYEEWLKEKQITLDQLPEPSRVYGAQS